MNPPTLEEIAKALWHRNENDPHFLPWENITGWVRQMMLNQAKSVHDLYEPFVKEHSPCHNCLGIDPASCPVCPNE